MGQVPKEEIKIITQGLNKKLSYLIIGNGKVANHFSYYFKKLNINHVLWARKNNSQNALKNTIKDADIILLLITDSEIENFIESNSFLKEKKLIHFSGSLLTNLAQGVHPLMTFGDTLYKFDLYKTIAFISDKEGALFETIFPELPNPNFIIPMSLRPYYHSLCVMSSNFTTIIWRKLFNDFKSKFKIPDSAIMPFFNQTILNIIGSKQPILTGPFERKDLKTIKSNLNSLSDDPFLEIYKGFVNTFCYEFLVKAAHNCEETVKENYEHQ